MVANSEVTPFWSYFLVGGQSPRTRTIGVFLFGLVNERIGDFALVERC
jgi:hypothetical protein